MSLSGNSTVTPTNARRHRTPHPERASLQASVACAFNDGPLLRLIAFIASKAGIDLIRVVPLPPPLDQCTADMLTADARNKYCQA